MQHPIPLSDLILLSSPRRGIYLGLARDRHTVVLNTILPRNSPPKTYPSLNIMSLLSCTTYVPKRPTKCPRCKWTILATNTRAIGSIHRHLETFHTLRLNKYEECAVCGFAGDVPTLKKHYQRFHSNTLQSPSLQTTEISNVVVSLRDSSVAVSFQEDIAATEASHV